MNDFQKITELIKQKYHLESITPISNINQKNIESFIAVFNPKIVNREFFLAPENKDKYLIQFRDLKKKFKREEIITGDKKAINKAMEYKAYLNQPIGISIHATCVAMGSGSSDMMIAHIDRLIPSLKEVFGWKFKLINRTGAFSADIKIHSTNKVKEHQALDQLQRFLDALAIIKNTGFHIQNYSVAPIPRHRAPHGGGWGPTEHMIPPLNDKEAKNLINIINANDKVICASKGLNQAYIENLLPSRVARLWATVEHIFNTEPQPLLKQNEIDKIINSAKDIGSLDKERLNNLKGAISSPERLALVGRNKRIAKSIASLVNINEKEVHEKIRIASEARGKNVHEISDEWKVLKESEKFLQEVLLSFINQNLKKTSIPFNIAKKKLIFLSFIQLF
ncbi:MAG: hypothetical protein GYA61_03775 [Spirochaetales bacterium]|nr:hypothetical protein [Spirochaetales bacterium]